MKNKSFDCVEMKDSIQKRLAEKYTKTDEKRRWIALDEWLNSSDEPLARKWRAMRQDRHNTSKTVATMVSTGLLFRRIPQLQRRVTICGNSTNHK